MSIPLDAFVWHRKTWVRLFVWLLSFCVCSLWPAMVAASCSHRSFSYSEEQVLTAYVAYYGRPADISGLGYWANRLDGTGGDLSEIIHAFGYSAEFDDNYGHLNNTELVSGLYWQLLGRSPDPEGLHWYVGGLDAGWLTLQSVALDIIYGVQNDDVVTVANRLAVSKHFMTALELQGLTWHDLGWSLLDEVTSSSNTRDAACSVVTSTLGGLSTEQELLDLVNDVRQSGYDCDSEGYFAPTSALTWNGLIGQAAQRHSDDMATNEFFDHTGSDGTSAGDRIAATGYEWRAWGENIAAGYHTAAAVIQGWLDSDGHCANIMNPVFEEMGIGWTESQDVYGIYWTQVFAAPW